MSIGCPVTAENSTHDSANNSRSVLNRNGMVRIVNGLFALRPTNSIAVRQMDGPRQIPVVSVAPIRSSTPSGNSLQQAHSAIFQAEIFTNSLESMILPCLNGNQILAILRKQRLPMFPLAQVKVQLRRVLRALHIHEHVLHGKASADGEQRTIWVGRDKMVAFEGRSQEKRD